MKGIFGLQQALQFDFRLNIGHQLGSAGMERMIFQSLPCRFVKAELNSLSVHTKLIPLRYNEVSS